MPQETNLNVAPYFDDFDTTSNYCKILFKPGLPVQARELTGIQSILQDQISKFGNHVFKEGASVTGGGLRFNSAYECVRIQISNEGIDVESYLTDLYGVSIVGSESGVKAKIKAFIGLPLEENFYVLFIQYLNTGGDDNEKFSDGESLLLDGEILETYSGLTFQIGEPIAQAETELPCFTGSAAILSAGIYYIRGYFIDVPEQFLSVSYYNEFVSAKLGLRVTESIVTADEDESLKDNASGFSNYTAPGADRLSIEVSLKCIPVDEDKPSNFIELMDVRNGEIISATQNEDYNELGNTLASRTFDESGNYYIRPYSMTARNTLNNFDGNNGIFTKDQTTYNNNTPSDDLGTYVFSPGKAYIQGYALESVSSTYLDFEKPRTTKTLEDQSVIYNTGPTFSLNNVQGSPIIGIGTDYTVSLRDQRIGSASTTAAGKEIGLARVFDFALESGSYNTSIPAENEWDISLYDIQTYTNITLNTTPESTISVPTHIKGKSSGAIGYLRWDSVGTALTAYNTKGKFTTGEQLIINGDLNGNIAVAATSYSSSDIKSIHGTVSTASTFNGDVKQSILSNFGEVTISAATTSGAYLGISTVRSTDVTKYFSGIATVGNLVSYNNTNIDGGVTPSYAKVESVSQHALTISGINTVSGICEGGLPQVRIFPSNFQILSSKFQSSTDTTLYTELPKQNISNLDLTNSHITIRKQFDVTITDNSTGNINSGSSNETFLPYDEENYILIRSDGTTEPLSSDKFSFNAGSQNVNINGLGTNSDAKLIATLRKINVTSKIKEKQKINVLTITNSKDAQSGIGTTTLNDGLAYGTVYGTRVQDKEISLNVPDVTAVYGIFESKNTSTPSLPKVSLTSINSSTAKTGDLLIGDKFIGKESNFLGIYVSRHNDSTINYISLNELELVVGEEITFEESQITATVGSLTIGSNNILSEFELDNGQKSTIYDISRIKRKPQFEAPVKQISIIFESAYFAASDTGDITTVNSYNNFDYSELPEINSLNVSDIIDIRPRVGDFSGTSRSPFEFLGRSFNSSGNSAKNILASDKSILLDYSFYLPRLDKVYLDKDGTFQLVKGTPAENPQWPVPVEGALEIAAIELPAYLYDIDDVSVSLADYKRYQMNDINKLEQRIKNLEFYTSLSLLENDALNTNITDSDGLNRFKSGFFVDDFSTTDNQIKSTIPKNSIDYQNGELRPSPHTTALDIKLDLDSANSIRKTGRVLTLDYDEIIQVNQPFATRVENVTPYLVSYYGGTIDLMPDSDIWVDQVLLKARNSDLTTYTNTTSQLSASEFDSRVGYSPVVWGAWKNNWTGRTTRENKRSTQTKWRGAKSDNRGKVIHHRSWTEVTKRGTAKRTGTRKLVKETFSTINEGPKVINTQIISNMRSRNIRFNASTLKPSTGIYAFFDGQEISKYIIPKLLEISMVTGTFNVGETVIGTTNNGKELIRFKLAQSNHKKGPIDDPTSVYKSNPYYQFTTLTKGTSILTDAILLDSVVPSSSTTSSEESTASSDLVNVPELYSTTSTLLNVDCDSLSEKAENTYHGYVEKGLKLVGQTSNAQATITKVRLRSDVVGNLIGSFFIPNPNDPTAPKFETGKKVFRLTSNRFNSQLEGNIQTDASRIFDATGSIETLQANIISVKNIATDVLTRVESKSVTNKTITNVQTRLQNVDPPRRPDPPRGPYGPPVPRGPHGPFGPRGPKVPSGPRLGPIEAAYAERKGKGHILTKGAAAYWKGQISKTLAKAGLKPGTTTYVAATKAEMTKHLKYNEKVRKSGSKTGQQEKAKAQRTRNVLREHVARGTHISSRAPGSLCKGNDDPLAQSFWVGETPGIYVTKVDVYFGTRDEVLPVTVQLRTMQTGLPTTQIIPFGEVILTPDEVNISDDASVKTTITFPSPVFLTGGKSYAVVLLSASSEYTAWISRMGEVDVQTKDKPESEQVTVGQQPTLGSLFKSQNGETWNPSQYEDLKFTLYRAFFTAETGTINFHNPPLVTYADNFPSLINDSLEITSN